MEQILNKLSEIETTANYIMEEASEKKQELSLQMEEQCRAFDAQVDEDTSKQVETIRRSLEQNKEKELSKLRQQTTEMFNKLDIYYKQNHEKLAKELCAQILKG